jgi:RNA polymerase sigma-70 factor (ECF subfamily)
VTALALDPAALPGHAPRLYRAARALCRTREDAEDLVQDTYAKVLAKPRTVRNQDETGYLLTVLRHTHISKHRSVARHPSPVTLYDDAIPDPRTPAETADLYAAIAALPDAYRETLVAVDVVGLSYREAAGALGVPEGTVMSRLSRARRQVIRAIGE